MISIGKSAVLGNKNTKECAFGVFSNHNSQFLMFLFAVKFGNQDIILQNLKNQDNILYPGKKQDNGKVCVQITTYI